MFTALSKSDPAWITNYIEAKHQFTKLGVHLMKIVFLLNKTIQLCGCVCSTCICLQAQVKPCSRLLYSIVMISMILTRPLKCFIYSSFATGVLFVKPACNLEPHILITSAANIMRLRPNSWGRGCSKATFAIEARFSKFHHATHRWHWLKGECTRTPKTKQYCTWTGFLG